MEALESPAGLPEAGVTLFHVVGGTVWAAPLVGKTATAARATSTAGTTRHDEVMCSARPRPPSSSVPPFGA